MMLTHIIDFLVDYFTNLNAKKIFGGILVCVGLATLGRIVSSGLRSGDATVGVLYAIGGILVGGVGLVIIYYDTAKDKTNNRYSELDLLSKVYKQNEHKEGKASAPDMNQDSDDKNTPARS